MMATGHANSTTATISARLTPRKAATPMTRLMLVRSFLPQYWLMRMPTPDWTPNTMEMSRNTGTLAAVTAAISALPRRPTMKVSAKPREVVMRFCSTMGSVSTQSLR